MSKNSQSQFPEAPRHQAEANDRGASVRARTAIRFALVATAWILRLIFRWSDELPSVQPALLLDVALVVLHLWAIRPLQSVMGDKFGKRPSWTAQLVTPLLLAIVLLVRDLWFAVREAFL